jgi:hypothetical protein
MVVKPFRCLGAYPFENDPDIFFIDITIVDWTGNLTFHREHSVIEKNQMVNLSCVLDK